MHVAVPRQAATLTLPASSLCRVTEQRFRKRPVVVTAIQWTGANQADVADFMGASPTFGSGTDGRAWVDIETLEGTMRADKGWWIIRGLKDELYPCRDDIFRATYEEIRPAAGAVIEIVERGPAGKNRFGVIVPDEVRLNGIPLLMPKGKGVRVHEVTFPPEDAVLVTLTLFARRVSIGADRSEAEVKQQFSGGQWSG
jgi:hypothetical protein